MRNIRGGASLLRSVFNFRRWRQQLIGLQTQRMGQTFHVVDGDIASLPLDMGDKGTVQPGFISQVLLRPTQLAAQPDHVQGQSLSRRDGGRLSGGR